MNISDILLLKFPNIDLISQVIIQDDGAGPYIKKWDEALGSKPDQDTLSLWESEVELTYRQEQAKLARKYKPITDQLDDLWHAMDKGVLIKVEPFYSDNKLVKDNNPIPKE